MTYDHLHLSSRVMFKVKNNDEALNTRRQDCHPVSSYSVAMVFSHYRHDNPPIFHGRLLPLTQCNDIRQYAHLILLQLYSVSLWCTPRRHTAGCTRTESDIPGQIGSAVIGRRSVVDNAASRSACTISKDNRTDTIGNRIGGHSLFIRTTRNAAGCTSQRCQQ